jgi:hypothetical protein
VCGLDHGEGPAQGRPRARRAVDDASAGTSVVAAHRAEGRDFLAAGVRSFVREEGDGETVLCLHGIPA